MVYLAFVCPGSTSTRGMKSETICQQDHIETKAVHFLRRESRVEMPVYDPRTGDYGENEQFANRPCICCRSFYELGPASGSTCGCSIWRLCLGCGKCSLHCTCYPHMQDPKNAWERMVIKEDGSRKSVPMTAQEVEAFLSGE